MNGIEAWLRRRYAQVGVLPYLDGEPRVVPSPPGANLAHGLVWHFGGEPSTSMQEFIAKAYGTESKDDIVVFVVPYITKQISSQEYFPFNQPLGIAWIDTFVDGSFPTPNPKYYGCAFVSARPWVEYDFSRLSSDREVETTLFAHEIGHLLTNYGHQSHKTNLMLNGDASSSDELRYNGANRLSRTQETLIRAHRSLQGGIP